VSKLYKLSTSQRTSSHAAHTLIPTLKWLKKKFLEQIALTSKISAWSGQSIHQNVGILVLFHPKWLSLSLPSQISHKSPLTAERRTAALILFHYKQAEPWNQCETLILKLPWKTSHKHQLNKNYTAGFPHPLWRSRCKNYSDTTSTFRTASICSRLVLHC